MLAMALGLSLLVPASLQSQSDSTWRDHNRAIAANLSAGDTAAYRSALVALERQVGATPRLAARLAAAAFVLHDTAEGIRWSRALAAMGVAFDTSAVSASLGPRGHETIASLRQSNAEAKTAVDSSRPAWRLTDSDMIAEDLSYDAIRHRFLVSSVHHGAIYAVDQNGRVTTFVAPGGAGVWGVFALGVDQRRGVLWATTAALPGTAKYSRADSARSALLAYDLVTGVLRQRFVPPDSGPHALGDLTLGPDGTVYVSDALGGGVYIHDPGTTSLRALLAPGTFSSPQTPVLAGNGRRLFVPDYTFGIAVVDLANGRWHWLRHSDSLALTGIDGLYGAGRDLIAVQNGLEPNRIIRLTLGGDDRVAQARVLVRGHGVDVNHAQVLGQQLFFISRSGWDRVADDGTMPPGTAADAPVIRRIPW